MALLEKRVLQVLNIDKMFLLSPNQLYLCTQNLMKQ